MNENYHILHESMQYNQDNISSIGATFIDDKNSEKNRETSALSQGKNLKKKRIEGGSSEKYPTFKLDTNEDIEVKERAMVQDINEVVAKSMKNFIESATKEVVQEEQEHYKNISDILKEYGIDHEGDDMIDEDTDDDMYDVVDNNVAYLRGEQRKLNSYKINNMELESQSIKSKESRRSNDARWNENFQKLENFYRKNGHCHISAGQADRQFYSWISRQRHLYKRFGENGKANSLTPKKIHQLNQIGFVWHVYDTKGKRHQPSNMGTGFDMGMGMSNIYAKNASYNILQNFDNRLMNDDDDGNKSQITDDEMTHNIDKTWDEYYEELKAYKLFHGDTEVPTKSDEYCDLGKWVEHQRIAHKQLSKAIDKKNKNFDSSISLSQIVKLNCLGFVWVKDRIKGVWEKRYEELKLYRNRFGDCNVPENFEEYPSLGKWVLNQRRQYTRRKNGIKNNLSNLRIKLLNVLGFEWSNVKKDAWNEAYLKLVEYKNIYGNCRVPRTYSFYPKLFNWVKTQREEYRLFHEKPHHTKMTRERIEKLDKIGFEWQLKKNRGPNTRWEDRLKELELYILEHGHGTVNHEKNFKLANWVSSQRKQYALYCSGKTSSMSSERINALNKIGFEWVVREPQKREDRMRELREYKAEFGNCMVPKRWPRNKRLGQWVAEQRKQYKYLITGKPSHMTPERVVELEKLGFAWSLKIQPQECKKSASQSLS